MDIEQVAHQRNKEVPRIESDLEKNLIEKGKNGDKENIDETSEYDSSSEDGEEQLNMIRRPVFIKAELRKTKEERVKLYKI